MRNIARTRAHAATHDQGAGGFLLWIAIYAAFMVALIAYSGGSHTLQQHMLAWPSFPGIG